MLPTKLVDMIGWYDLLPRIGLQEFADGLEAPKASAFGELGGWSCPGLVARVFGDQDVSIALEIMVHCPCRQMQSPHQLVFVRVEVVTPLEPGEYIDLHLKPICQHLQHSLHLTLSFEGLQQIFEGSTWLRRRVDG